MDRKENDAILTDLEQELRAQADPVYKEFFMRISPNVRPERILGIKTPELKKIAASLDPQVQEALIQRKSRNYYEEDLLAVLLVNSLKDPSLAFEKLESILPALNNWSLTDGLTFPKLAGTDLLKKADELLLKKHSYSVRLGILWIMKRGFRPVFEKDRMEKALSVSRQEPEIKMAQAWLLCEGVIRQPEWFLPRLKSHPDLEVQRLAIGKCCDSFRVPSNTKDDLRQFRKDHRTRSRNVEYE